MAITKVPKVVKGLALAIVGFLGGVATWSVWPQPPVIVPFHTFVTSSSGVPATCEHPINVPTPPVLAKLESRYDPADTTRSVVDTDRNEAYNAQIRPLRRFERDLTQRANAGEAMCVADALAVWAKQKALRDKGAPDQGRMVRAWALASLASAYGQIDKKQIPEKKRASIERWLTQLTTQVQHNFPEGKNRRGLNNNHAYWATWARGIAAAALDNRALYEEALGRYRDHMADIQTDGTLPLEMERGPRALYYHAFAAAPLLAMTLLAEKNGDLEGQEWNNLSRLFNFMDKAIEHPAMVPGGTQDLSFLNNTSKAMFALYACRAPASDVGAAAAKIAARIEGEESYSRLGGDIRALYCQLEPDKPVP